MPRQQEDPPGRPSKLEKKISLLKQNVITMREVISTDESGARKSGGRRKPAEKERDRRFFEPEVNQEGKIGHLIK
jgi:hypothetical protein